MVCFQLHLCKKNNISSILELIHEVPGEDTESSFIIFLTLLILMRLKLNTEDVVSKILLAFSLLKYCLIKILQSLVGANEDDSSEVKHLLKSVAISPGTMICLSPSKIKFKYDWYLTERIFIELL